MSNMSNQRDSKLGGLDPIVELYHQTNDERYVNHIIECYRGYIQGRAYITASRFGLDEQKCESTLMFSLFNAVESFDRERGIPFKIYVKMKLKQDMKKLFYMESRDPFFGPSSRLDADELDGSPAVQLLYSLDNTESYEELTDYGQDVANLVADEDAAQRLLEAIRKVDVTAADVASLTALGYTRVEVATILKYCPDVSSIKPAQINWVNRRLEKCIKPAQKYYTKMGRSLPIKLKK